MRIAIFKLNRIIISFSIIFFIIFLIIYSSDNITAVKNGIYLWGLIVVPSLFPFLVAAELLSHTNVITFLGKSLDPLMRPLFNVPGIASFALIMGLISGYPVGAKIVCNFKKQGLCSEIECERMLSFTSYSSPLFIIGSIGIGMFSNKAIGLKLFFVHFVSSLVVGILFRMWKNKSINKSTLKQNYYLEISKSKADLSLYNFGEILSNSIESAIKTILSIGGFIILFSVISSILSNSKMLILISSFITPLLGLFKIPFTFASNILLGLLELTNGIKMISISNSNTSIILCSFLLGFGGLSILFQVISIASHVHLSIKPYIIGKLLQACFSAFFMWLIL